MDKYIEIMSLALEEYNNAYKNYLVKSYQV